MGRRKTDGVTTVADRVALKAIMKDLSELPERMQKKACAKALRASAKIVQQDARALAPLDTGRLERAIKVRAAKRSRRYQDSVRIQVRVGSNDHLFIGDEFYAGFVELGHRKGNFRIKQDPDPFLRPALWSNAGEIVRIFREQIREFLKTEQRAKVKPSKNLPQEKQQGKA